MKTRSFFSFLILIVVVSSCSKNIDYSSEYIEQTSGRYMYTQDEVIEIYYDNKKLFLKWRGAEKIKPVILDKKTFFIPDMYKKFHFVQHPETKKRYMSIIPEDNKDSITYDYLKLEDTFKLPNEHLKNNDYDKALAGYLAIKEQDSTSVLIDQVEFNRLGYQYLRKKEYQNAINVFKINVALYSDSDNVYDSLADAYLRSGDSLQALNNYRTALKYNTGNRRAKKYIEDYNKKQN